MAKRSKKSRPPRELASPAGPPTMRTDSVPPSVRLAAIILAVSLGVVYLRAIDVPFVFDDVVAIAENASIRSLWPPLGTANAPGPLNPPKELPTAGRPLVNLSFALNYHFGELKPRGYHALNVLIHFASTLLLWGIVRRTLALPYFAGQFARSSGWLALAVALLWALHPLQTEAVIYTTQRTELMMAFCYLATLYCSLRYWLAGTNNHGKPNRRALWPSFATIACLAGMASKEVMVSAPLIVLLFDRTFLAGSLAKALRNSWPLYLGLACTWLALLLLNINNPRGASAGFHLGFSAYSWWLTQCKVLLMYFKLVIWPAPLLLHYEMPYITTLSAGWPYVIPVAAIGLGTLYLLWLNRPVGFLGTWVFAILLPTFVVPILTEMAAERRMYLPLAAILALIVIGAYMLAHRTSESAAILRISNPLAAVMIPALFLAVVCGVLSIRRLHAYHNPIALWTDVLRYQPQSRTAHHALGYLHTVAGNTTAAIDHFREEVRLAPESYEAHYNLASLLMRTQALDEAATHLTEAARINPAQLGPKVNLAAVLSELGRYDESIQVTREALKIDPVRWASYYNLGYASQRLGKYQDAIDAFQQALRHNPQQLSLYNDVAANQLLAKDNAAAIKTLEEGLQKATAAGNTQLINTLTESLKVVRH